MKNKEEKGRRRKRKGKHSSVSQDDGKQRVKTSSIHHCVTAVSNVLIGQTKVVRMHKYLA
jgi:hypothetical protein